MVETVNSVARFPISSKEDPESSIGVCWGGRCCYVLGRVSHMGLGFRQVHCALTDTRTHLPPSKQHPSASAFRQRHLHVPEAQGSLRQVWGSNASPIWEEFGSQQELWVQQTHLVAFFFIQSDILSCMCLVTLCVQQSAWVRVVVVSCFSF